jgi:hypothetical protein
MRNKNKEIGICSQHIQTHRTADFIGGPDAYIQDDALACFMHALIRKYILLRKSFLEYKYDKMLIK